MILTSPIVVNNGSADITFTFQHQRQEGNSIVQTYKDLAASQVDEHIYIVKYDLRPSTLRRNASSVRRMLPIADGTLKPVTFNVTAVYHKEHVLADVQKEGVACTNMALEAGFWNAFLNQM